MLPFSLPLPHACVQRLVSGIFSFSVSIGILITVPAANPEKWNLPIPTALLLLSLYISLPLSLSLPRSPSLSRPPFLIPFIYNRQIDIMIVILKQLEIFTPSRS